MAEASSTRAEPPASLPFTENPDAVFQQLEKQRLAALLSFWRTIVIILTFIPLGVMPFTITDWIATIPEEASQFLLHLRAWEDLHRPAIYMAMCGWLAALFFTAIWLLRNHALAPRWAFIRDCKQQLFTHLCRQHFPTLTYLPDQGIGYQLLDGSGLFPFSCDTYRSEDLFAGAVASTDVRFAEARAERQRRRLTSKGYEKVSETYFRGLIFVADFHKHFHSTTRIVPKDAKVARSRRERVTHFEDPRFENRFTTWTSDEVDVRYLMSTSMMERFTELNRRFRGLRARFHDESLTLLLPSHRNRFEPSLYRRVNGAHQVREFVNDVRACLSIVDALNLNTRIWSKH